MACFVAFLLRLHLCHDIVKLGGFFLSGCFIQVLHVRDDFNSSVSKTVSWWVGRWVGTWASHDDVIKWKHFPRYWPFERESPGHRWIPLTKSSDEELWCFLWSAPEQTVKQTIETPVIWNAIALIITSLWRGVMAWLLVYPWYLSAFIPAPQYKLIYSTIMQYGCEHTNPIATKKGWFLVCTQTMIDGVTL